MTNHNHRRVLAVTWAVGALFVWSTFCWTAGEVRGQRSARALWRPLTEQCVDHLRDTVDQCAAIVNQVRANCRNQPLGADR